MTVVRRGVLQYRIVRGNFAQLKRTLGGKLWMQHSGRASFGYSFTERAGALAAYGKRGEHKCERHVGVPVGRDPRGAHYGRGGSKRARGGERAGIGAREMGGGSATSPTDSGPGGGGPTHFGGTLL